MKKNIIVQLSVEGIHHWPTCNIKEVSYLKDPHRHIFYITCKKTVSHNDRDIEIIQLKHNILNVLNDKFWDNNQRLLNFDTLSCESIAEMLVLKFDLSYCSVLEDNENGAEIFI